MGFLDKLKGFVNSGDLDKLTDAVGKTVNTILNEQTTSKPSAQSNQQPRPTPRNTAAQTVSPAKPSRKVTDCFYDGEDSETTVEYSFMLSGDFVETDSGACEIDYAAVYAPESSDDYAEYDPSKPSFVVMNAAEKEIYDIIENFKKGAAVNSCNITRISLPNRRIYFKAKLSHRNVITYFYALDRGEIWKNCYIGVNYPPAVQGTPLESKLQAIVDEAAATYTETIK